MPTIAVDKAALFEALGREYAYQSDPKNYNRYTDSRTDLDTPPRSLMSCASSLVFHLPVLQLSRD